MKNDLGAIPDLKPCIVSGTDSGNPIISNQDIIFSNRSILLTVSYN
jgi:hypothetical protein